MKGFVAPLDPTGEASLYGPMPWLFAGRSITVFARASVASLSALIPAPLELAEPEAVVRFSVHDLTCDLGFGWEFAQRHPARSCFREAAVGIAATFEGTNGYWDPFLWCDGDAEIAVGREMFGWPQVSGALWVSHPHPIHGWQAGDKAAALVNSNGREVFELGVDLVGPGSLSPAPPAFDSFYTYRVLPDPVSGTTTRTLYRAHIDDVEISDLWHGDASLSLRAPELASIEIEQIIGAHVNAVAWAKTGATKLYEAEL